MRRNREKHPRSSGKSRPAMGGSFFVTPGILPVMTQPCATILAALIVLCGVIGTLIFNAKQLVKTQLRQSATERHKRLQDEYALFIGACFDFLANLEEIADWQLAKSTL